MQLRIRSSELVFCGLMKKGDWKLMLFSLFLAVLMILWEGFLQNALYGVPYSCSSRKSQEFIDDICSNYRQNRLNGSLCIPLCSSKEIIVTECLGHGVKPHVLQARWKDTKIVLKEESPLPDLHKYLPQVQNKKKFKMKVKVLLEYINATIHEMARRNSESSLMQKAAEIIINECDVRGDGFFNFDEVEVCMQLATTSEYLYLLLLQGYSATVDVYGTCGTVYGVQYVASDDFYVTLSSVPEDKTWRIRSRIVSAVLDMIVELKSTPLGELYLCDMQKSNIGLVRKEDGRIVAKAIDTDSVMFEQQLNWHMKFKLGNPCHSDYMCGYMHCRAVCDKETSKCTGKLASTNLFNVCERFIRSVNIFHRDMLSAPPTDIKDKLEEALKECLAIGNHHIINEKELIKHIKLLLNN